MTTFLTLVSVPRTTQLGLFWYLLLKSATPWRFTCRSRISREKAQRLYAGTKVICWYLYHDSDTTKNMVSKRLLFKI